MQEERRSIAHRLHHCDEGPTTAAATIALASSACSIEAIAIPRSRCMHASEWWRVQGKALALFSASVHQYALSPALRPLARVVLIPPARFLLTLQHRPLSSIPSHIALAGQTFCSIQRRHISSAPSEPRQRTTEQLADTATGGVHSETP